MADTTDTRKSGIDLSINKHILRAVGIWYPRRRSLAYVCYSLFMMLSLPIHLCTELWAAYESRNDLTMVLFVVCPMLIGTAGLLKGTYFIYKNRELQELVNVLEGPLFAFGHQSGVHQRDIILKACRTSRLVTILNQVVGAITPLLWVLMPIVDNTERGLPLIAAYPFDKKETPGYQIAFAFESFTAYSSLAIISSVDAFCTGMMIHVSGQLEALGFTLENIFQVAQEKISQPEKEAAVTGNVVQRNNTSVMKCTSSQKWTDDARMDKLVNISESPPEDFCKINSEDEESTICGDSFDFPDKCRNFEPLAYQTLVECVQHHQAIIKFGGKVQRILSPILFIQCVASSLCLCVGAYMATDNSGDVGILMKCMKSIPYLVGSTYELWIYCMFADDIMYWSTRIAHSTYNCDWTGTSRRFKYAVFMIIMRAQKTLCMKGGFFYIVSLQTFAAIINTSYSYYTLLRNAKN